MDDDSLTVETYAGYKGEPTPRAFICEGLRREVTRVADTWYTDRHYYFRLSADDGHCYVVRYELDRDRWELAMQEH